MIIILESIVDELLFVRLFDMFSQLSLPPLRPNEVGTFDLALTFIFFIFFVKIATLPNKPLCLLPVPPRSALDYLSDGGVVISNSDVKFEVGTALLRF